MSDQGQAIPVVNHPGSRLVALDALRGIAAIAVVWLHIYYFSRLPELLALPSWLDFALKQGGLGVQVFFVLSGIVITLSVRGNRITRSYVAYFALRRSLRLDPPYWATLLLASLVLVAVGDPPGIGRFVAHVFYLQNIFQYRNIVSQFWTLCYEVQFYLALVLLIGLGQRAGKRWGTLVGVILFCVSLLLLTYHRSAHGWFLDWWYAFALGVATAGMLMREMHRALWAALLLAMLGLSIQLRSESLLAVTLTAAAIGLAGWAGKLVVWTGGPLLQWLGRISYSLYLIHFPGPAFAKFASLHVHGRLAGAAVFGGATAISLLCAATLHYTVERPALQWSRRADKVVARLRMSFPLFPRRSVIAASGTGEAKKPL